VEVFDGTRWKRAAYRKGFSDDTCSIPRSVKKFQVIMKMSLVKDDYVYLHVVFQVSMFVFQNGFLMKNIGSGYRSYLRTADRSNKVVENG